MVDPPVAASVSAGSRARHASTVTCLANSFGARADLGDLPLMAGTGAGKCQLTGIVKSNDRFRAASSGDRSSSRDRGRVKTSRFGAHREGRPLRSRCSRRSAFREGCEDPQIPAVLAFSHGLDPELPVELLQSCPTAGPRLFAFRIHEAAARGLREPATSGRSTKPRKSEGSRHCSY